MNPSSTPSRWYRRYPKLTLLLVNLGAAIVLLGIAEIWLRSSGEVPGYLGPRPWEYVDITRVDSLIVDNNFETGADGIFRAVPEQFGPDQEFRINSEGFRDAEFDQLDSTKTRLMFIGDSFTWGASAEPITECFVELVEREGYECLNLGIPGSEPNQYALIAEKYVPRFQPDYICVMFFMGNDIMYEPIELGPFQHKYHQTNAGWLNPYLDGPHIPTAQETYAYYLAKYSVPNTETQFLNRMLAKTVVGTRFWMGINFFLKEEAEVVTQRKAERETEPSEEPVSYVYLDQIRTLCEQEGGEPLFFALPEKGWPQPSIPGDYPDVFRDLAVHCPQTLSESDFRPFPDSHYNNEGHQKIADFILETLAKAQLNADVQGDGDSPH